jgi:hypothetical protein
MLDEAIQGSSNRQDVELRLPKNWFESNALNQSLMKIDLELNVKDDIEYFKTLFFRNFGTEQMLYYFHADDVQVRIQVAAHSGSQMITMGFFNVTKDKNCFNAEQFCPLTDNRYQTFDAIQKFWSYNSAIFWAEFTHAPDDLELAYEKIREILYIVCKVNNLKAFL